MSTDKKTITAYDKYAKSWAERKNKIDSNTIYHIFLEKPAIYSKLPPLKDKSALCVGCGSGEEVEFLGSLGAKKVVGIDISKALIEIAKKTYLNFDFKVMDVEKLNFPDDSFDFVFSSLTMHYLRSWSIALKSIYKIMKKNGIFLFSFTHPFFSATQKSEDDKIKSRIFGYKDYKKDNACEVYGDYLNLRKVEINIGQDIVVTNYHRPLTIIIKEIISSGFEILDIIEPKALSQSKKDFSKFWEIHQKIPEFMIFELKKK